MSDIVNNREIATAIWLFLFAGFCLSKDSVRKSISNLLKSFCQWQILVPHLSMVAYMFLIILALRAIRFWDISALKGTLVWIFGVGFALLLQADKADESFFKRAALNNVKLVAVLEFLSNTYTFSLITELVMVPLLTLVGIAKVAAEFKARDEAGYRTIEKVLGYMVGVAGLVIIAAAIYKALYDFNHFATFHRLRDFLMPVVLSGLYLPFVYGWALFLAYDRVFVRINIFNKDRRLAQYLKKTVVRTFHVRLWRLVKWSKSVSSLEISDIGEAVPLMKGLRDADV